MSSKFDNAYDYNRTLFTMLPPYYQKYLESKEYIEAIDKEFARLFSNVGDVHKQLYAPTATWLLGYYAKLYGIDTEGDGTRWIHLTANKSRWQDVSDMTWRELMAGESLPDESLRERVLAAMRAQEISSIPSMQEYIEKLTGYKVELQEFNDQYSVSVYLKEGAGSSLILNDIIDILRPLVPAHIALFVSMEYIRWVELDIVAFTWEGLDEEDVTWEEFDDKDVWSKWLN